MKVAYFLNTIEFLSIIEAWALDRKRRGDTVELVIPTPSPELESRWKHSLTHFDRVHTVSLDRSSLGIASNLRLLGRYIDLYRKIQPDLVLNFTLKPVVFGTFAAIWTVSRARILNILTGMGYAFTEGTGLRRRFARWAVSLLLKFTTLFRHGAYLVLNPEDQKTLSSIVPSLKKRLHLLPGTGTPIEEFPPLPEPHEDTLRIAYIGRMLYDKGVGDLVAAVRLLKHDEARVSLRLYGGLDPENPSAIPEPILRNWEKEGLCEWVGSISPITPAYRDNHVIALPSYREGLPRVLVEAGLSERASIAANTPGCRDVIIQGETGLLFAPQAPTEIAQVIQKLIRDPQMRKRMAKAARAHCASAFSYSRVFIELERCISNSRS